MLDSDGFIIGELDADRLQKIEAELRLFQRQQGAVVDAAFIQHYRQHLIRQWRICQAYTDIEIDRQLHGNKLAGFRQIVALILQVITGTTRDQVLVVLATCTTISWPNMKPV
jgi:hypothetical protein